MSVSEAQRNAIEQAKIKALAEEFGTYVSMSNSSIVSESNGELSSHFVSVSGSDVKGDWLETIGKPDIKISFDDRMVVVTCSIEGYAVEKKLEYVDYTIKTLRNAPNLNYESSDFNNGDDLIVYFKSPVEGYLNIFLLDHENDTSYCLLPYKKSKDGSYKVEADKDYFFFSKDKRADKHEMVDEYVLSADNSNEINEVMIVFSPKQFSKVSMNLDKEASVPRNTSIAKLNKWIAKLKRSNENIITSNNKIIIHNNE